MHNNITPTDATADHPPDLPSMNVHHSKYNVVHESHPNHVTGGSGPGSQSLSHRNSEMVPTSDISSEGSKLLQMLQAQGGGNEGQSVELTYMSAAVRGGENCPSQGQRASTVEISIAEEVVKTLPSPHGTPQQSTLPPHKKHGVNDSPSSPLVIQPPIQSDDSLQVLHNDQQQYDNKMSSLTDEKEKDKKNDTPPQKSQSSLRSCSKQVCSFSYIYLGFFFDIS